MLKRTLLGGLMTVLMISGVFVNNASAAASITVATGGGSVSIDTTSGGGTGAWTSLTGPVITEGAFGEINTGSHSLTLPAGWEFNTAQNVTIAVGGGTSLSLSALIITPTATTIDFYVSVASGAGTGSLTFSGIQVRPTGTTPGTGDILHSAGVITGVTNETTNFGTLTTIAGTVTKVTITTPPSASTEYGSTFAQQPIVKTQDQFGNNSTNGLAASKIVTLSLSTGTGTLDGDVDLDIGTGDGNGTATFVGLKISSAGAVGEGKKLTAAAPSLTSSAESDAFAVTAKAITITAQTNTKTYDGDTSSVAISTLTAGTLAAGDTGTYSQTYDDKNYSVAGKTLTPSVVIRDAGLVDVTSNYTVTPVTDATGVINKKAITITAAANEKVYNDNTAAAALPTITVGELVAGDVGVYIETYDNQNVGVTKALTPAVVSIVDGSSADMTGNYDVTLTPASLGTITVRPVNVTAQTNTKVYNADTTSVATPVGDALQGDDTYVSQGTQTYDTKDVGTGKILTASGASITESGNYEISYVTDTTGVITAKGLTVTDSAVTSKTYDGTTTATITGATLAGVEGGEGAGVVALATATSGTFDTKNIGVGKTVTSAMTLTGTGTGNYTLAQPTLTGTITIKAITITAAANEKVYNGDTTAAASPTITVGTLGTGDTGIYIETYDDRNVGVTKTLTPAVVSIVDGSSADMTGNYDVTLTPADLGTITVYAITVTAGTETKVYDGDTTSDGAPSVTVGALQTGDTIAAITQTYDTRDVGTGKTLTASGVVSDGNSGNNYTLTLATNTTGEITARPITVTAATDTKVYDDNTSSDGVPTVTGGSLVGGDVISAMTQTYATKTVGSDKTINAAGVVTDGNSGDNYTVTFTPNITGVIRHGAAASFTVTPSSLTPTTNDTLNVVVTAKDAYDNVVDGGNGATAFTGIVFLTTNATGPIWYNQVGNITTGGTKTFTDSVKFPTAESGVVITAENSGGAITGDSSSITVSAGPVTPTIAVTAPTAGATLSATSTLTFTTNSGATTDAYVSIDGATYVAATTNANPGTYTLVTTGLTNGSHTLRVKDTVSGLTGYSDYITFIVANNDSTAPSLSSISVTPAQSTASVAFTSDEAGNAKVGYGLTSTHGNMTSYSSMISGANTIVLTGLTCGTTYHYSVYGKDSSNNESVSTDATFETSACTEPTEISVTNTSLVKRVATKNGLFADGWKWILDVTAPTASTTLAMSFDNFTGAGTILAADNIRFYSAESSDHSATSSAIVITAPGAGTVWSDTMTLDSDLSSNPGRQIQITIEAAVPSGTTDGAYSASYDIQ